MKIKIGLFAGGMETYWKDTGMAGLSEFLTRDALRLKEMLSDNLEVVFPGIAVNKEEARNVGKLLRENKVDMALMYHANYVDDDMSLAFLEEIQGIFPVSFLSQGIKGIPSDYGIVEAGTTWGVNSSVQIHGTLKRVKPELRYGFVFGEFGNERIKNEIEEYARAARAVKNLKGKKVAYFPHRTVVCPMYDTYPDDAKMMEQTGIKITFLYTQQLVEAMNAVTDIEAESLCNQLYEICDVIEPPRTEVFRAAKMALALQEVVEKNKVDALAIDMYPEITQRCGMIPCVGMDLLLDQGYIVATEGDLGASVAGLLLKELTDKPICFWENLGVDEEKNWLLGGHEGGSAGFSVAKKGVKPKLRCTQYVNFANMPGAPYYGVIPEFITNPGRVTLLTLFRDKEGYEMRMVTGESVDTDPRPVHYEHTIVKPDVSLNDYFHRIREVGVCHHFALVHADISKELNKTAEILGMKLLTLT